MITIATLLWDPNDRSFSFSRSYDESWVEKLYRGFARNLTRQFRFVCYTDRDRDFCEPIEQRRINSGTPGYGDCIQPYEMDVPMILVGLDTIITGNIDHLADHCLTARRIALPLDPYKPTRVCNGVALVPGGMRSIFDDHRDENDMEWLRAQPHDILDTLFPGQIRSYKVHVKRDGLSGACIVYFHGEEKPHQLPSDHPVLKHWI